MIPTDITMYPQMLVVYLKFLDILVMPERVHGYPHTVDIMEITMDIN